MLISQHDVAESDDLPDVSTRDANTHELNAMPTHMSRVGETKHSGGKWSEGPRTGIFRTGPWLFRNSDHKLG